MRYRNKILTLGTLSLFVILSVAAVNAPSQKLRNLKVLPKDISDARLDSIMQTFNKALGVKCDFCHAKAKFTIANDNLDYFSDAEPMKNNAREMMEMTIHINKTYFNFADNQTPDYLLNVITCKTCHRGEPFPPAN
jgi:Photosynthetic reaction centre cytochrome C subunit